MSADPKPRRRSIREDAINLPNLLTFARIALIPAILYLIAIGTPQARFWAVNVYTVTAVTDFLDGWLARRQGLVSVLGKFLDPLADKLLVMAVLVYMVALGDVPWLAVVLLLSRELSITSLRVIAMTEGVVIAAGRGGKDKTAFQMVAIMFLIVHHPYELYFGFGAHFWVDFNMVGLVLLYLSILIAFTSATEYVKLFVEAVEKKEERLAAEEERSARK
ncbi:MAG: CDP-diacylglycerol--glycerol-3-phosphate 3-phosphatidyltransferase [Sandaracinaceae bacterium]|nr:CDP-diacylglycerol--glycerol-3-phosphate 3-phosphatidyltransferase [Sandaracinaceae bacterium]